jgi:hypothetical protein
MAKGDPSFYLAGTYLYFKGGRRTGNEPAKSRAVVYSEELNRNLTDGSQYKCMTFLYYTKSAGAAVIRIHQVDRPEQQGAIWEDFGLLTGDSSTSRDWQVGRVPLDDTDRQSYLV